MRGRFSLRCCVRLRPRGTSWKEGPAFPKLEAPARIPTHQDGQSGLTVGRVLWISRAIWQRPVDHCSPRCTNTVLPRRFLPRANARACSAHHGFPGTPGAPQCLGAARPRQSRLPDADSLWHGRGDLLGRRIDANDANNRAGRESRVLRALLIVVEQHLAKHWPDRRATSSQERDQFLRLLI